MPKVHFLNEIVTVEAQPGQTIQEVAEAHGIMLHRGFWTWANCRGLGLCGSCKVWTRPLVPNALSEKGFLEKVKPNVRGQIRVGCLARILGDCEVRTKPGGPPAVRSTEWAPDPRPSRWKQRLSGSPAEEGDDADGESKPAAQKPAQAPPPAPPARPAASPSAAAPAAAPPRTPPEPPKP